MAEFDTIATLAAEFGRAFQRVSASFRTPEAYADFLEKLGWRFSPVPPEVVALQAPIGALVDFVSDGPLDEGDVPELILRLGAAFGAIADLANSSNLPADFKSEFPRQLADFVVVDYFLTRQPRWGFLLMALGIIQLIDEPAGARPAFIRRVFAVENLSALFSDPLTYLKNTYKWGQSEFDGQFLGDVLSVLLTKWGLSVATHQLDPETLSRLAAGALLPDQVTGGAPRLSLFEDSTNPTDTAFDIGVEFFPLPETATDKPGFALLPFATGTFDAGTEVTDKLTLEVRGTADLTGGVGVFVRPDKDVTFLSNMDSGAPAPVTGDLSLVLDLATPGDPIVILGTPGGTRLEVAGFSATAGARFRTVLEVFTEFAVAGGKIVVKPASGDSDSFLASLLPGNGLEVDFNVTAGFSTIKGLYFGAAGKFEIDLPAHLKIGPVEVASASAAIRIKDGAIPVDLSATFTGDLSVLKATVEKVGLTAQFSFPDDRKGNLGPADLALKFKPPTGVGIAVSAGPVHGGGFISFEPDLGRYSGAVELSIYDISVKAFGLIETKVPGVSFSFVIVISAEFTPIQLGFGFTLNGVGGLVGINRTINSNELGKLVREGRSENLLFPKNLIANAPTIIRDLGTVFPARQSHYVFGPLGKFGWGTPTLITAQIGIVLELPGPVIVLLGEIKVALPKPDVPLVKMNMSVVGTLDFPNKLFSIDAALHDSIIEGYPISGQMALRVKWGDQPNFVASVGGFHPSYQPPKEFPKLQPMAMDLGEHGNASITVSGFFAVTSNTVQVGGDARLHAGGSGISLDASVSVKALFVFSPFHFAANIDASVRISFHGHGPSVHLSGLLEGPSPWHIRGEVCVSILFWDACLGFDQTFGGGQTESIPELDPWEPNVPDIIGLRAALADAGNWSGVLPAGTVNVVSRAQGSEALVDPLGGLSVHQKAVPVETDPPITRFGVAKVKSPRSYKLPDDGASIGGGLTLTKLSPVNDFFAPAQYFQMDDGKKLSAPGFEQEQAGYVFGENPNNLRAGSNAVVTVEYQSFIIAADGTISDAPKYQPTNAHVQGLNKRSAVALGGSAQAGTRRFIDRLITQAFDVRAPKFILSSNLSLTAITGVTAVPRTAALLSLDAYRAQKPEERLQVQVSAFHELAA